MIVEVGGGKGGFKNYLENGIKVGRDFHRNELDQRVPLFGDLDVFELATSLDQGEGRKYDHITLSFSERHVTDEMLQIAVDEFRDHALAAWPEEDRHRVPFYAEAHRPKLQSYVSSETGEDVERFIHIHIGMGRHDLANGKAIEPLGFLGPGTDNIQFIDAWQESFNSKYGFASPKDNPKITPENALDVIARYTGQVPDAFGTQNEKKAALELTLQKEVISQNVTTWEAFSKLLSSHGEVSKINEGKFNESYRIKLPEAQKAMRLKGVFFQRQFIERSTVEKISIISDKARVAYLEQMQPRKEPQYVAGVLAEWHKTKAKEFRYLNTGGRHYKNVYLPADAQTRIQILNDLERKDHGISRSTTVKSRKNATARNRMFGLPIRDLDGIQSRTEMLLSGDTGMDVRAGVTADQMGFELRQTDGGTSRRAGGGSEEESEDRDHSRTGGGGAEPTRSTRGEHDGIRVVDGGEASQEAEHSGLHEGHLVQPSSFLARVQADLLEKYEQAADKDRYSEIRKNLDCDQLLARLSHSHGLNPSLYQVTTAKDGTPRIKCGSRALSPSDFLMKELGLPWKEAAPLLRQVYENQIGKLVTTGRVNVAPAALRREFKSEQLAGKPAREQRLEVFDAETKKHFAELFKQLKIDQKNTLYGLTGDSRKAALSLEKKKSATVKAEFNDERRAQRKVLQPTPAEAWRVYLQARAQEGNDQALAALRKLNDKARAVPVESITGTIFIEDEAEKKRRRLARESTASILKMLVHTVERNGDVTYHQNGRAVMRDEGQHLAVLDENSDEAIYAALLLGREKFGTNLALTGSPEFQRRVVAVAVAQGVYVKFIDPQLETLRVQLVESKRRPPPAPVPSPIQQIPAELDQVVPEVAEEPIQLDDIHKQIGEAKAAADPLHSPIQQIGEAVAVASEIPTESQPHQVKPEPIKTAAEWITTQPMPTADPYANGALKSAFTILYVAPDGVVLNHGRTVAIYPLQPNIALKAGDKVVIGKAGALSLAGPQEASKGIGD